jgi:hypothetical protein
MYSCSPAKNNEAETENSNMADSADIVIVNNAEIYDDYAVLPLCETLTSLGFNLTWLDNDHATFVCNEVEYKISISEKTLTKSNGDENYLICAPGNAHFVCEVRNGTLMVDDNTVQCLFQAFLDYPVRISIDYDENVIIIEKQ